MAHMAMSHGTHRNISYRSHRTGSWRTWRISHSIHCTYIYTYIYILYTYVLYINVYVRICVNIYYMNIYIFVCVNISIYTYTYIYIYICTKDTYSNDIAGQGARGPVPLFGGDDLTRCQVLCCQVIWSSIRCPASSQALG